MASATWCWAALAGISAPTGEIAAIRHDAASVFAPRPFLLVVLARGASNPEAGSQLIATTTRQLYLTTQ